MALNFENFDYHNYSHCYKVETIVENNISYEVKHYSDRIEWTFNNTTHRVGDLPAIIYVNGGYEYVINGNRHRANGKCAYKNITGNLVSLAWYVEGKLKRKNGKPIINISLEQYNIHKKLNNF